MMQKSTTFTTIFRVKSATFITIYDMQKSKFSITKRDSSILLLY
jgi:hypothetical protein